METILSKIDTTNQPVEDLFAEIVNVLTLQLTSATSCYLREIAGEVAAKEHDIRLQDLFMEIFDAAKHIKMNTCKS